MEIQWKEEEEEEEDKGCFLFSSESFSFLYEDDEDDFINEAEVFDPNGACFDDVEEGAETEEDRP